MGDTQAMPGLSANLKKAVSWIGETVRDQPEKSREEIITEAQLRFDLTPRECEFLNQSFLRLTGQSPC